MIKLLLRTNETFLSAEPMELETEKAPSHLYKILSSDDWQNSQNQDFLTLSPEDDAFIHFSKEDQLERLISKYHSKSFQFVILKIETGQLVGELVYEANPGGIAQYYHLYNGFIPFSSIAEVKNTLDHDP